MKAQRTLIVLAILINSLLAQSAISYYTQTDSSPFFKNSTVSRFKFQKNDVQLPSNIESIEENIQIQITNQDTNILDIQIKPLEKTYRIYEFIEMEPYTSMFDEKINESIKEEKQYLYTAEVINNGVKVVRKLTKEVVFDTSPYSFLLNQVYMEVSTILPTNNVMGLGERNFKHLRLPPGVYTLYGRDEPSVIELGQSGGNVYSSHPMYLMREKSGNFHVVFLKNSAGIDAQITENSINFKAIGGIAHFKIFFGDKNPETAIKMYHKYLGGGYIIPPFWSMGYHQSRWGYTSGKELNQVVDQYVTNGLPIDTIWSDIDYFKSKKTFAIDSSKYRKEEFDLLKKKKVKFIGIIDSAIGEDQNIGGLSNIDEYDAFCRSPNSGEYFKGNQWAGNSYFIDFFNPNSEKLFENGIKEMEKYLLQIDGIWLDMNEPANFCNGECQWYRKSTVNNDYKSPAFRFPYIIGRRDLATKTLPPNLKHFGGNYHKDVHNLYGMQETFVTYNILKKRQAQPFILTRSSFAGTGKFSFKWSGDNVSNYEFLQTSLTTQILFNFFGIPMVGSDICGFMGDTTPELCMRWVQLGMTYPFARNHNHDQGRSQELYNLGDQVKVSAKKNLKFRYSILKHMYTLFIKSERVGTIQRPLFFEFPDCEQCYLDDVLDYQFMMGSELLFTPILIDRIDAIKPLFPQGDWYDLLTGLEASSSSSNQGKRRKVYNPHDAVIPVFLRDGYGVARQDTTDVINTQQLTNQFYLVSALREEDQENLTDFRWLYTSQINMLDLEQQQYFNEEYIEETCMTQKKCVFTLSFKIGKDKDDNFVFKIQTSKKVTATISFKQITLYGVHQNISNALTQCELNGKHPYKVSKLSTKGSYDLLFSSQIQFNQFSQNELMLCYKHL